MKKITLLFLMFFSSFLGYSQLTEGFEGTALPVSGTWALGSGSWAVFDNGVGTGFTWNVNTGTTTPPLVYQGARAAYMNGTQDNIGAGNSSQDWLVTPAVTVPTNGQLRFFTRQTLANDQGTIYQIRVSTTSQTDASTFTVLQQWTENSLNATFNIYEEKVVPLAFPSGTTVYLAFVMVVTQPGGSPQSDRWLVDQVNLVEQCLDPANLTANAVTLSSANLTWTNTSGATSWEIEIVPATTVTPSGHGVVYNGALPYAATGTATQNPLVQAPFQPDTEYKYYVRALCASGTTSNWVGPFNFTTGTPGETCSSAIQVPTLPYSTTDNTANYGDSTDVNQGPNAGCGGGTTNYMTGNDVFYSYTPIVNEVISITFTPGGTWSGIFVYNGCANVGVSCVAGVANTGGGVRVIPALAVTAGQTYIIAISTNAAPQTIPYTLVIQKVNCTPPSALAASNISQTGATLSWANPGNLASSWEVAVQTAGSPIPTGSGVQTNTNTAYLATTLSPSTAYQYYVRADCGDGTFSSWTGPFLFNTQCSAFNVPFTEGFNSTSTTQFCWTVLNSNGDADLWNMDYATTPFEGNQSAMMYTDFNAGNNNDWLISPTINLTGNQRLKFHYRVQSAGEPNDFEVKLSTTGVGEANFTETIIPLASYSNVTYIERIVNINAYTGPVNIAWHVPNGGLDGWRIYIDNVIVEDIPTCPNPSALTASNFTTTSAQLSWTAGFNETQWQVVVQAPGTGVPAATAGGTPISSNPYIATTLTPSTQYEYYVRAYCASNDQSQWVGPFSFTTLCTAFDVPFYEGFNSTSTTEFCWTVINSNADADAWDMNYATTPFEGNQSAMMYTDFNNGNNNDWLISPTINLTGNQRLKFHYRVQSSFEPNDFEVKLSTTGTGVANFTETIIPLASYSNTTYIERIVNINSYTGPVNIAWHVPNGGLDGWRIYIDNVIIEDLPTCPDPENLTATNITSTTANLGWSPVGSETQWQVVVQLAGTGAPTGSGTLTSDNPYTADTLLPYTAYEYYVRAYCLPDDQSNWIGPFVFTTAIANDQCANAVPVPVNPAEECIQTVSAAFIGATPSTEATTCGTQNAGDIWFEFVALETTHLVELLDFTGSPLPISLALYSGDDCGNLTQLFCSYNNFITATGLVEGQTYKVRASLNTTSTTQTTAFDICVKTPLPPTGNNPTECQINTVNHDFEFPDITSGSIYPTFINHNTVPGWRTTASDEMMEYWNTPNYENVSAYSGTQFIELNANVVSGIYQDYETPQNTIFNYGFAHRGRQGTDTCQLLAGPPGGPYVAIATATTGNTAWSYNTGSYSVPNGQPITRFIFQSISSVGGISVGNYLDSISFTANNGILSPNPLTLDCTNNVANVTTAGVGSWVAQNGNPTSTTIANPSSNATTISGFGAPGVYRYDWNTLYCSSTLEITYNGAGVSSPTVTNVTYCLGQTPTALTAGAETGNTLNWYTVPTGGTPSTTAPVPSTAVTGTTTYYVSQTSSGGCQSPLVPIDVIVNPMPLTTIDPSYTICEGTSTVITGTPVNYAVADASYVWLFNGGPINDEITNQLTVTDAGVYTLQVTLNGCTSSVQTELIVNQTPDITITSDFTICTGNTGTITVTPNNDNSALWTYSWMHDGGSLPDTSNTITATEGGIYEVTVTNLTCSTVASVTVTEVAAPVADAPSDASACQSYVLPALTAGDYYTGPGGTGTQLAAGSTVASTQLIYVYASNGTDCTDENSFTVTIVPAVQAIVDGGCQDNAYIMEALPVADSYDPSAVSYSWALASAPGTELGTGQSLTVSESGEYLVTITTPAPEGCTGTFSFTASGTACQIQKGISPNGDGKNDSFDLSGLQVRKISIFNRYGTEVYGYGSYTDQWHGQSDGGDELPDGTYYYMFERQGGESKTGWIYINRQRD